MLNLGTHLVDQQMEHFRAEERRQQLENDMRKMEYEQAALERAKEHIRNRRQRHSDDNRELSQSPLPQPEESNNCCTALFLSCMSLVTMCIVIVMYVGSIHGTMLAVAAMKVTPHVGVIVASSWLIVATYGLFFLLGMFWSVLTKSCRYILG